MNKQFLRFTVLLTSYSDNSIVTDEVYRFAYDGFNRVSQVVHTKNDGSANTINTFTYRNDTIYDTTRYVNQSTVTEVDTFIVDSRGFIAITYLLGVQTTYSYLGNLLTRVAKSNVDYYTYNSYNNNFTKAVASLSTINPIVYYTFYTDLPNRPGDYLQLNSDLRYGFNFYQNSNLVRSIAYTFDTTKLTYVIDADSKITRTTAVTYDTAHRATTEVYDIQYEKFK